jgi:hypothetical protein
MPAHNAAPSTDLNEEQHAALVQLLVDELGAVVLDPGTRH